MESIQSVLHSMGLGTFTWVDYLLLFIVGLSMFISVIRGFLREAISLITWVLAFWLALKCSHWLAGHLEHIIPHPTLRTVLSIVILLIAVLLGGMLVAHCADRLIKKGKLSTLDRLLGMFFGLGRGVLIAALLLFFGQVLALDQTDWWKKSKTIPWLKQPVDWLQTTLPHQVERISMMMLLNKASATAKQGEVSKDHAVAIAPASELSVLPEEPQVTMPPKTPPEQPIAESNDQAILAPTEHLS